MLIRELRREKGLTQAEVAQRLEVDQGAVSHWENGRNAPIFKYRKKLAEIMGCTEEEILRDYQSQREKEEGK